MKLPAIVKSFEGRRVLDFPGADLEPGTVCAVIGPNGSGKSTFAKVLAGVLAADGGRCAMEKAGYLPQRSYGFRMSVRENLLLKGRDGARAEGLMEALQITHLANKPGHRLSGGETARMALARLLMGTYDLVILDEPTAAMDMEATILAEGLVSSYVRETGCALILVTHSLQQAKRLADRVLFFQEGRLVEDGAAAAVLERPNREETRRFLEFYGL